MTASEFIAMLQRLVEAHGDLPVYVPGAGCCGDTEPYEAEGVEFCPAVNFTWDKAPDRLYVA